MQQIEARGLCLVESLITRRLHDAHENEIRDLFIYRYH